MLVDSHAHLSTEAFDNDRDEVIQRAFQAGIRAILCPGEVTVKDDLRKALNMAAKYPNVIAAAGIHPHAAKDLTEDTLKTIADLAARKSIHAVGEIGLDFHYNFSSKNDQIEAFRRQLQLAESLKLPVIIHSRLAEKDITETLAQTKFTQGGVLHCFTESSGFARDMLDLGFYVSFSGIVTFPNAHGLRQTARELPLEKLLVETDSPYLTPAPHRGKIKRNEPWLVKETAAVLAGLKQVHEDEFASVTTRNFETCFMFEITNL
jgi:TatD DNase family protein